MLPWAPVVLMMLAYVAAAHVQEHHQRNGSGGQAGRRRQALNIERHPSMQTVGRQQLILHESRPSSSNQQKKLHALFALKKPPETAELTDCVKLFILTTCWPHMSDPSGTSCDLHI